MKFGILHLVVFAFLFFALNVCPTLTLQILRVYVALCYLMVMDAGQDALQSQSVTHLGYFPAPELF